MESNRDYSQLPEAQGPETRSKARKRAPESGALESGALAGRKVGRVDNPAEPTGEVGKRIGKRKPESDDASPSPLTQKEIKRQAPDPKIREIETILADRFVSLGLGAEEKAEIVSQLLVFCICPNDKLSLHEILTALIKIPRQERAALIADVKSTFSKLEVGTALLEICIFLETFPINERKAILPHLAALPFAGYRLYSNLNSMFGSLPRSPPGTSAQILEKAVPFLAHISPTYWEWTIRVLGVSLTQQEPSMLNNCLRWAQAIQSDDLKLNVLEVMLSPANWSEKGIRETLERVEKVNPAIAHEIRLIAFPQALEEVREFRSELESFAGMLNSQSPHLAQEIKTIASKIQTPSDIEGALEPLKSLAEKDAAPLSVKALASLLKSLHGTHGAFGAAVSLVAQVRTVQEFEKLSTDVYRRGDDLSKTLILAHTLCKRKRDEANLVKAFLHLCEHLLLPVDHKALMEQLITSFSTLSSLKLCALFGPISYFRSEERSDCLAQLATLEVERIEPSSFSDIIIALIALPATERAHIVLRAKPFLADIDSSTWARTLRSLSLARDPDPLFLDNCLRWFRAMPNDGLKGRLLHLVTRPTRVDDESVLEALAEISSENQAIGDEIRPRVEALHILPPMSDSVYEVNIKREQLTEAPLEILENLSAQFSGAVAYELLVRYHEGVGIDAGGLGKDFITGLMEGLKEKLQFIQLENGLYRPSLLQERKAAYQQLGELFMFCLNASKEYPIGMIFDEGVFAALTKIDDALFTYDAKNPPFEALFAVYEALKKNNENDRQEIALQKSLLLPLTNDTSDEQLVNLAMAVAYEDEVEGLRVGTDRETIQTRLPKIREHHTMLQGILQQVLLRDQLLTALPPLIEIARGMKAAQFKGLDWPKLRNLHPRALSEKLQGVVTRDVIIQKLDFSGTIPKEKQLWLSEWIKQAPDAKIKQFLFSMTGASAVGQKGLRISATSELPIFHTCFNHAELRFPATKEEFILRLEISISDSAGFNIG